MCAAFEKAPIAVCAERLHDADVNVRIEVTEKSLAIHRNKVGERAKIIVKQVFAKVGRKVGLCVEEKGSEVILQSAFASPLIIDKKRLAVAKHDVTRLEVAIDR